MGGYLLVRQSDAQAWSEIWLEDRGWVRVDPTAAVAPERIEGGLLSAVADDEPVPGRLRGESELWMQFTLAWDAANDLWNERVLRFDGARQFELPSASASTIPSGAMWDRKKGTRGIQSELLPEQRNGWGLKIKIVDFLPG